MIEIERKAWVNDVEGLRASLAKHYGASEFVEKRDRYFLSPPYIAKNDSSSGAPPELKGERRQCRLRIESDGETSTARATAKYRRIENDTEINEEIEFGVDDPKAYAAFLTRYLGFDPLIDKHKRTESFRSGATLVELNEVVGLGWFLEVEVMAEDRESVAAATAAIDRVFELNAPYLGPVENRRYTQMMADGVTGPEK